MFVCLLFFSFCNSLVQCTLVCAGLGLGIEIGLGKNSSDTDKIIVVESKTLISKVFTAPFC